MKYSNILKSILLIFVLFSVNALAINENKTKITQIRNATVKIEYGGKVFLIDPMFAPKDAGDAKLENGSSIIMGKEDVLKTHKIAQKSVIIATHMEAVNHASLTREELKIFSKENGIEDFIFIPKDGESLEF